MKLRHPRDVKKIVELKDDDVKGRDYLLARGWVAVEPAKAAKPRKDDRQELEPAEAAKPRKDDRQELEAANVENVEPSEPAEPARHFGNRTGRPPGRPKKR